MKIRAILVASCLLAHASFAADEKIDLQASATISTVLEQQVGKVVELRLSSGDKLGGTVTKVVAEVVHISQVTGAEFSDAVVDVASITAVVIRTKSGR